MCKIFCFTNHNPAERDALILKIWEGMAVSEKDGYGAAWFSPEGEIGYYKSELPKIYDETDTKKPKFGFSNNLPSDGGFLIIHGRTSTCPINLENTHPMLDDNAALVHNGIVRSLDYKNINSGCDSELILRAYQDKGIESVEKSIYGYFAFMMLRFEQGEKRLHIARDSRAPLVCGEFNNSYVFSTNRTLLWKINASVIGEVKDHTLIIFKNKDDFEMKTFKSLGSAPAHLFNNDDMDEKANTAFADKSKENAAKQEVKQLPAPAEKVLPAENHPSLNETELAGNTNRPEKINLMT